MYSLHTVPQSLRFREYQNYRYPLVSLVLIKCSGITDGLWLFYPQQILFQTEIQHNGNQTLLITTHFEAHDQSGKTRKKQYAGLLQHLATLDSTPWILGGDLNMSPPADKTLIGGSQRICLDCNLYDNDKIGIVPDETCTSGSDKQKWFTAHETTDGDPNPSLTLDYILYNKNFFTVVEQKVLRDGFKYSDHSPVLVVLKTRDDSLLEGN